jgi:hypothetical protein
VNDNTRKLPVRRKTPGDNKLFLVRPPANKCNHFRSQFEIDEDAGKCRCMRCGEEVSPMFVLEQLMKQEQRELPGRNEATKRAIQNQMHTLREHDSYQ